MTLSNWIGRTIYQLEQWTDSCILSASPQEILSFRSVLDTWMWFLIEVTWTANGTFMRCTPRVLMCFSDNLCGVVRSLLLLFMKLGTRPLSTVRQQDLNQENYSWWVLWDGAHRRKHRLLSQVAGYMKADFSSVISNIFHSLMLVGERSFTTATTGKPDSSSLIINSNKMSFVILQSKS